MMGEQRLRPYRRSKRQLEAQRSAEAPSKEALESPVTVVADPEVPEEERAHAASIVSRVARHASRPVLHARVELRKHDDPALDRPATVSASLDLGGHPVRAHAAATSMRNAVDLLAERLRRNLEDSEELQRTRRRRQRRPRTAAATLAAKPEPAGEPELVTGISLAASPLTPEQAELELQGLDLEFLLFTNTASGEDEVVYRGLDDEIAHEQAAPVMLATAAVERLEASGESFVFFVDALTRRGNVLHRRADGRYGLVEAPVS